MSSDVLALTRGEWLGPIPHDYEAKPEWLADDAIVMVAFNPREHQVAMTWEFAEKRKAPARERDWAAVTAFCVEIPSVRRPTPAGDAVEDWEGTLRYCEREWRKEREHMCRQIAELRAAIAAMGGAGWRPIETAPRDGMPFLAAIWVSHNDCARRWDMHVIGYDGVEGEMNSDFETGWDLEDYSHWMPLPPAPETQND